MDGDLADLVYERSPYIYANILWYDCNTRMGFCVSQNENNKGLCHDLDFGPCRLEDIAFSMRNADNSNPSAALQVLALAIDHPNYGSSFFYDGSTCLLE